MEGSFFKFMKELVALLPSTPIYDSFHSKIIIIESKYEKDE